MTTKEIVMDWDGAVADGDREFWDVEEAVDHYTNTDDEIPAYLDCYNREPMSISASHLVEHMMEMLDDNYYSEGGCPSENTDRVAEDALVAKLQPIIDEYLQNYNWKSFTSTNKVLDLQQYLRS